MNLHYIKIQNFTSYKNETIDFTKFNNVPILIQAKNGSGKSSIIDAITTCLFFRARNTNQNGNGMEKLIRLGEDSFHLEFEFDMNNNIYKIIRDKNMKSQKLYLYINNIDVTGKLKETQEKINNIIKMDYDLFVDTICLTQNNENDFMDKTPIERKNTIIKILKLDKYSILESYTKDIKKDINIKIENISNNINQLDCLFKQKNNYKNNINVLNNEIHLLNDEINKLNNELEKQLIEKTKYNELKKQQDNIINRKNNLIKKIDEINSNIKKFILIKNEMESIIKDENETKQIILKLNNNKLQLIKNIDNINNDKINIITNIDILKKEIQNLQNQYNNFKLYKEANCKFCGQLISNDYKSKHIKELIYNIDNKKEKLNILSNKYTNIKQQLLNLNNNLVSLNNDINNNKKYIDKINLAIVKVDNVKNRILDNKNQLMDVNNELKSINDINIVSLNKIFNDNELKQQLQNKRYEYNSKISQLSVYKSKIKDIDNNKDKYEKLNNELKELKIKYNDYDKLQEAWSNKGIQNIIITNILPQIENEINYYLNILSDNMKIKFITKKENKKGKINDTLDILVYDSKGIRNYELYSGGEKTRIDFACHIGMSKFLSKRSGANINTLIIDEGMGTLDQDGVNNFINMVQLLTTIFNKIIIISHIEYIQEFFNNKIIISKDEINGSTVKYIY